MPAPDHQALLDELRVAAPAAPASLRLRIEQLAAAVPAAPPTLRERLSLRRVTLVAAPVTAAALLAVAVVQGVDSAFEPTREAAPALSERLFEADESAGALRAPAPTDAEAVTPDTARSRAEQGGQALPPAKGRKQDYRASLTVRVPHLERLSEATQQAIRLTRGWGGFVVSAEFAAPGTDGVSELVLRVPVRSVQTAVQRLSELGTLAAQDVAIRDVQGQLDGHTRRLLALQEQIADLRARLAATDVTAAERARLEARIARAQRQAAETRAARTTLARRAAFATVTLTLTTEDAAAAMPAPGRIERAARDAGAVLAKEVAWILYALIVAAPFALLAAAGAVAIRTARRRADARLLEHA